jgi:phosphatidylglycerol:prolipoprotein diacylglycerol transferase
VFSAISYDPLVHIKLGPLSISPHGIGIAVGFLLGARLLLPEAKRKGITEDDVYALLTRAAIGAILGARIAYVINHFGEYGNILGIFKIWEGGISLLGGFIGAIALALPEMRKRRLSFWKVMDAAAPGMALGVVIGRIGDLVVADHLGKATNFVLGYRCPPITVDTASKCIAGPGRVVFQPALIDFLLTAVLLFVLLRLRRKPRWDGFLILFFTIWYGAARIIEDFMRVDETHGTGLTGSQWTSVILLLLALAWLTFGRRTPRWGRWDERPVEGATAGPPEESGEPHTMAVPPEREE